MSPSTPRWVRLIEPTDDGQVLVNRVRGKESVSRLFEFDVLLAAPVAAADRLDNLLGKPLALELNLPGGPARTIAGLVREVEFVKENERMVWCSAKLVPPVWPLSRNRRSRVFQNQTAPKILSQIFERHDVVFHLRDQYLPHNYCVQYGESDFAFACRLMEEEGIYYYFEFEGTKCRLAIADSSPQAAPLPGRTECRLERNDRKGVERKETSIQEWRPRRRLTPNKVAIADHSFELTNPVVSAQSSGVREVRLGSDKTPLHPPGFSAVIEEYPAGHAHRFDGIGVHGQSKSQDLEAIFTEGDRLAQRRLQREQRQSIAVEGAGDCIQLAPGYAFRLTQANRYDGDYFLTSVDHDACQPVNAGEEDNGAVYKNRFRCTPIELPYRPAAKTRKPSMQGLQTAQVVGPPGEEIYTDPFGRVKVRFFWDNSTATTGDNSCWLRVAHSWAGKGWGMITLPRVGQEVLVGFIDGDPDMPIIVGSVHNVNQPPTVPLPALKTVSGFVSRTSGGDSDQYHRIVMSDQPGKEMMQLHSERDLWITAENSHTAFTKNQHSTFVGGKHRIAAGGLTLSPSPPGSSGSGGSNGSGPPNLPNENFTGAVVGWDKGYGDWQNPFANWSWSNFGSAILADLPLLFFFKGSLELDCAGLLNTLVMGMNDSTTMGFASRTLLSLTSAISPISTNGYFPTSMKPFGHSKNPLTLFGLFHVYGVDAVKLGDVAATFGYTTSLAYGPRFEATHGTSWRAVGNSAISALLLNVACKVYAVAGTTDVMLNAALPELCGLDPDAKGIDITSEILSFLKPITLMVICATEYSAYNATVCQRRATEYSQLAASKSLLPELPKTTFGVVADAVKANSLEFAATLTSPSVVGNASDDLELIYGNSIRMASNISMTAIPSGEVPALISLNAGGSVPAAAPGIVSIAGSLSSTVRGGAGQISMWGGQPSSSAPIGGNVSILTGTDGAIVLNPNTGGSVTVQNGTAPTYTMSLAPAAAKLRHSQSLSLGLAANDDAPLMPAITLVNTPTPSLKIALNSQTYISLDPTDGIVLKAGGAQISLSSANGIVLSAKGDRLTLGSGPSITTSNNIGLYCSGNINMTAKKVNSLMG